MNVATLLTRSIGYPEHLARVLTHFSKRWDGYKNRMPNALKSLKVHIPVQVHVPLPPNLAKIKTKFVRVPDPVTLEYTIITVTLPLSMPRMAMIDSKDPSGKFYKACTLAKIDFFYDKGLRGFYATRARARLCILDPSLLP